MSIPKISIIVPAFNAEHHIKRCLDSICNQTFTDFETIIIDDGSTDATGKILDEYATRDKRFRIIHKQNGGVAAARQDGIDLTKGEYTLFIDSDDYITPDTLQELYHSASTENADIVICDFNIIRGKNNIEHWHQEPAYSHEQLTGTMLYLCSLWNKLIRSSCYRNHGIRFTEGINASEDQLFVLRLLAANNPVKATYVGKALYQYDLTQNAESITNSGVSASARLLPLRLFRDEYDITPMQSAYDNAILHIAYDYLKRPDLCPDFKADFRDFKNNIRAAKGFPIHVKLLVLLRLHGIRIPVDKLKKIFK